MISAIAIDFIMVAVDHDNVTTSCEKVILTVNDVTLEGKLGRQSESS